MTEWLIKFAPYIGNSYVINVRLCKQDSKTNLRIHSPWYTDPPLEYGQDL